MNVHDLTHPDDRELSTAEMAPPRLERARTGTGSRSATSTPTATRCGCRSACRACATSEERPLYLIGQVEDVTERRALRERLAYAAIHDPLTGLPNRELFMDRLEVALRRAARSRPPGGGDLPRPRPVQARSTTASGHDVGDQRPAGRGRPPAAASCGPSDTLARFGGDEFTVLCDEVDDEADALEVAQRLVAAMDAAPGPAERGGLRLAQRRHRPVERRRPSPAADAAAQRRRRHVPGQGARARRASRSTARTTSRTSSAACAPPTSCTAPSSATSWSCTTSPSSTSTPRRWSGWRRSCGGSTRPGGCCAPASSSPWPRTAA